VLHVAVEAIELDRPFRDLGLTSLAGTDFRIAIEGLLVQKFPSALLFNHPNLNALAAHLVSALSMGEEDLVELTPKHVEPRRRLDEPLAIVGIGLRLPGGVRSLEDMWALLRDGRDTVTEIPRDRWDASQLYDPNPKTAGKMNVKWGSFVEGIDQFDPQFFGISPREAESMDPQQRLLLELAWEAFEHAGLPRSRLLKSATGVFVGMMNTNEYARRKTIDSDLARVTPHTSTGDAMSIAAGRISFFFGLQGPALAIDTACSSSLVALHLAATSLRIGECSAALVAGVNLIAAPSTTMSFAKTRMLSPRGRCRTFDATADGYVRAEGGCALVMRRLSDAIADHDNVLAVVRGTAVNQDGRSSGLTAPNGIAQRALIAQAIAASGVSLSDVTYVETHGTGTALGDPIEVQAIADVFGGSHEASNPLYLGALKANLGHMEACSGLAGLAKVLVAMRHRELPRQIHIERINPNLGQPDWLVIPLEARAWAPPTEHWIAGVSSFGFSGTNAHAVLEAAPPDERSTEDRLDPSGVVCLSGASREALLRVARELAQSCATPDQPLDICGLAYSSSCRREHFPFRAALVATGRAALIDNLEALVAGSTAPGLFGPNERAQSPKVGFLYSADGSNHRGVGLDKYASEPLFRIAFDRCSERIASKRRHALSDVVFRGDSRGLDGEEARLAQFAWQYAFTEMWAGYGVAPSQVLGRGVGDYAAACAAGLLDLEAAVELLIRKVEPPTLVSSAVGNDDVSGLVQAGCNVFLAVGPSELLDAARVAAGANALYIDAPRGDGTEPGYTSEVLARLFVAGVNVNWDQFYQDTGRFHPLPPHPFARRRFWLDEPAVVGSPQ
jgi:acyl transferase domain-containing protein